MGPPGPTWKIVLIDTFEKKTADRPSLKPLQIKYKKKSLFARERSLGMKGLTLATLRPQYWIAKGRSEVKRNIRACTTCSRHAAWVPGQLMGDLPKVRVRPSSPYEHSSVDYASPIHLRLTKTRGKGTMKGYIAIFICMATRAIHIEVV